MNVSSNQSRLKKGRLIQPARVIYDAHGRGYRLNFDPGRDLWIFNVSCGRLPAGHAYCWLLAGVTVVRINDLVIRDDIRVPTSLLEKLLRRLFGLPPRTVNFQRRGLGTALLRTIIDTARANGIHRVCGEVMPKDVARFPGLKDWYAREGFSLGSDGDRTHIELKLS